MNFRPNPARAIARTIFFLLLLLAGRPAYSGNFTVTTTEFFGPGSLFEAVESNAQVIDFAPFFYESPQTIQFGVKFQNVNRPLQINGPGADLLTIDGSAATIASYVSVDDLQLNGLTLRGFVGVFGTVLNLDTLTLRDVHIHDSNPLGVDNAELTLIDSTISNAFGPGISARSSTTTLINSTVSGSIGAGVFGSESDLVLRNSTIASNGESGVDVNGFVTIESSIIADNGFVDFVDYGRIKSASNNLIETGADALDGLDGNIVGVDPLLGTLTFNGGSTPTLVPMENSPAIDAGSNPLGLTTDQRGFARVRGGQIDIGSVETIPEPATPLAAALGVLFVFLACRRERFAG